MHFFIVMFSWSYIIGLFFGKYIIFCCLCQFIYYLYVVFMFFITYSLTFVFDMTILRIIFQSELHTSIIFDYILGCVIHF